MPTNDGFAARLDGLDWSEITEERPVYRVRAWRKPNEDGADRPVCYSMPYAEWRRMVRADPISPWYGPL